MESINLCGRRVIYSDYESVTRENVIDILNEALPIHLANSAEINFLYRYYKGKQPIRNRKKDIRDNINNKVIVNRANEIVSFKTGYLVGNPVQYVCREGENDDINTLNDYMFIEDKAAKDKELADWFYICGTAYRFIRANETTEKEKSPFDVYTLDPRYTFVVYSNTIEHKPLMGVTYIKRKNGTFVYYVYTENTFYQIESSGVLNTSIVDGKVVAIKDYIPVGVPIIEYPANSSRLGAFEIVITLLDAINTVESNRIDGVEQFVQALFILFGTTLEDSEGNTISIGQILNEGGIALPEGTDAKYLTQELNQTQTQTLIDDMYETVLTICGMPNRNGGTSTSDTGTAVLLRDGWSSAEARALDVERLFDVSEKHFLSLAIEIMNTKRDKHLTLSAIEIKFTRRNYENIQAKAQVLTTLLANDKVHPLLAYEYSGMFTDPLASYTMSMEYFNEKKEQTKNELKAFMQTEENSQKEEINNDAV